MLLLQRMHSRNGGAGNADDDGNPRTDAATKIDHARCDCVAKLLGACAGSSGLIALPGILVPVVKQK